MGFLSRSKPPVENRTILPSGSFTVDREGCVIASTVSSRFPQQGIADISRLVLQTFSEGRKAGLPLGEFNVKFGAMNIRAVEMRGGAMIFLSPRGEQHNRIQTKR